MNGRGRGRVLLVAVSAIFAAVALRQAWTDGPTVDEAIYLGSGLTALTRHDLRITRQHPPLYKILAAAPVLLLHPTIPRDAGWRAGDEHRVTVAFVHAEAVRGHLRRDFFAARLVPIAESVAIAWMIALLCVALFGPGTGFVAGALWLLDPLVLGVGHLDGIDIPSTLATLVAVLTVLHARRDPSGRRLVLVGLALGTAILTRSTGLLLVPAAVVAVGPRRAVRVVATAWATIAVAFAILATPRLLRGSTVGIVGRFLFPPDWISGLTKLAHIGQVPGPSFALGHLHTGRWILFWPAMLAAKLPPTTLLVLVATPLAWFTLDRVVRREAAIVVGLPAVILGVFTLQQQRPIGLRYLLPVIALWLVLTAPLLAEARRRAGTVAPALLVGGAAVVSAMLPSLSWTNPALGPGFRVATDSNLDWGQSYPVVRRWTATHDHPWVEWFGVSGLTVADLPGARDLRAAPTRITGWVAVSASKLTAYDRRRLSWLRAYCPVDVLARTVLVYRFDAPPDRTIVGPDAPARECAGRFSVRTSGTTPGSASRAAGTPS